MCDFKGQQLDAHVYKNSAGKFIDSNGFEYIIKGHGLEIRNGWRACRWAESIGAETTPDAYRVGSIFLHREAPEKEAAWIKNLIHSIAQALGLVSPLVLDLNGDGVKTTSLTGTDACTGF